MVDEEAFMMWKDDLSRDFPGKERTLFQVRPIRSLGQLATSSIPPQVNQWLSILEEEEDSEDEEA